MANGIRFGFLAALAASFVVFLTLILTVFDLSNDSFILSLTFLLGMMVFSSVSMGGAYRNKRWGWLFVMFSCLIIMLFAYVVYITQGVMQYHTVLLASSIILFAIALVNIGLADPENRKQKAPQVKVYQSMEKVEPYTVASAKAAPAKKSVSKGKFVASKMATHYHTARCEWTPNIKRRNRIWFATEASAKRAKFKPHECVK
jgi:hypothetical protein